MTRKLINDYFFYKIVNINGDIELCYVGSTVNFNERVRQHRSACNNESNGKFHTKLYTTIREYGGWREFKMVLIGTAEQLTLTQAHIIEEKYRVELKAELNTHKCFTTDEERIEQLMKNKEQLAEKRKVYYEKNKEEINEKMKEYCQKNKEQITEYRKEYYENNKEQLLEKSKENYEKNKEQIAEKMKEKIICECGCIVRTNNLLRHKKNKKHINLIEKLVTKKK